MKTNCWDDILFVSYATTGSYMNLLKELEESLGYFGHVLHYLTSDPFDNHGEACRHKQDVIQTVHRLHPHRPLMWIDADSLVVQDPIPHLNADHDRSEADMWLSRNMKGLVTTETILLSGGPVTGDILDQWIAANRFGTDDGDQGVIRSYINDPRDWRLGTLHRKFSAMYSQLYDQPSVIEHHRAHQMATEKSYRDKGTRSRNHRLKVLREEFGNAGPSPTA